MRRLLPDPAPLALDDLYAGLTLADPEPGRDVHLALCMVSSADGAVAVDGLSGGLGGPADVLALSRLRAANDVSLVGAGTVREEGYGPMTGSAERRADRAARGLRPAARLAIVTRSAMLDPQLRVFSDPSEPPLILTSRAADPAALAALEDRAEIHVVGSDHLDVRDMLGTLASLGLRRVVCEGGPRLVQQLLAAGVIDEAFLTIAPLFVGGPVRRVITGDREHPTPLELVSVYEHDGDLLLRYQRPSS